MPNFFDPTPAETTGTQTPSAAEQALAKFRTQLLGRFLGSMAGQGPTFASFAKGGPATRDFPGGFDPMIAELLNAMNQPGAFTSTETRKGLPVGPSGFSDLMELLGLGGGVLSALGISPLEQILKPIGGLLNLTNKPGQPGNPDISPYTGVGSVDYTGQTNYGPDLYNLLAGADPTLLPPDYGVSLDSGAGSYLDWLGGY